MDTHDGTATRLRAQIDLRLAALLPPETAAPQNLHRAMRYSALAPGKRLRGIITLLAAQAGPAPREGAIDFACAIELVHAASLVIDDLPMMDDAVMRRGQPATHRIFGEDTATLAAFALLNAAYGALAGIDTLPFRVRVDLTRLLHEAVGTAGLTGGQELDLHEDYTASNVDAVSGMYHQKTGVLFIAAAAGGARIAGLTGEDLRAIRSFGSYVGLAYQLADDLADSLGTTGTHEASIVPLLGRRRSQRLLESLVNGALRSIAPLGAPAAPLAAFAAHVFNTATLDTSHAAQTASA